MVTETLIQRNKSRDMLNNEISINGNNLYNLKRQIFNLMVILGKKNELETFKKFSFPKLPKIRIVTSLIEKYHVALKTTVNLLNNTVNFRELF